MIFTSLHNKFFILKMLLLSGDVFMSFFVANCDEMALFSNLQPIFLPNFLQNVACSYNVAPMKAHTHSTP